MFGYLLVALVLICHRYCIWSSVLRCQGGFCTCLLIANVCWVILIQGLWQWHVRAYVLNLDLTPFSGEWMSPHIPRASKNGISSIHPEEVWSFWWSDNQHIHSPNTQRIGVLAQPKHYSQVLSHIFQAMGVGCCSSLWKISCLHDTAQGYWERDGF
jgi:hypothetical protein